LTAHSVVAFLDDETASKSENEPSATEPPPITDWKKFFEGKRPPSPDEIRTLVLDLSQAEKYEDVIALLEQAILHGQIQPWMYEALALNMEVVGRPREQIARVLLSSVDLVGDDVDSTLLLAAHLTRYERYEQALRLYRRVAALEPLRVEPYVMALGLAEKLHDPATVAWSAPGVLMRAWGKNHEELHSRAVALGRQTAAELRETDRALEAATIEQLIAAARQRDLHVTLDWNGNGNLDLEIIDPTGAVCTNLQPASPGGVLHIRSGQGPRQEDCVEEAVAPMALAGEYQVVVKHTEGDIVGKRARLTIAMHEGSPHEVRQTQTVPLDAEGQTVRVLLKRGRLPAPLDVPVPPTTIGRRPSGRRTTVRQLPDAGEAGPNGALVANVGFQPVIALVPSGVQMSALALVSADRRYVRITTSPLFTSLTDVFTFSFTGAIGPNLGGGSF
jgi:hypothetical protein